MNFNERLERLRVFMEKENLDAVIISDPFNQFYLTGFDIVTYSRPIFTLITNSESILIVPGLEEEHAKKHMNYSQLRVYYEHPEKASECIDPVKYILKVLSSQKEVGKRIGVESNSLSYRVSELLKKEEWELFDVTSEMIISRSVKNEEEINKMRQSCSLAVSAVKATFDYLKVGVTELDLENAAEKKFYNEANLLFPDSTIAINGMTPSGEDRTILPHVFSSLREIESGDGIIITRISSLDGYKGECERTCFVGKTNKQQEKLFNIMVKAQTAALSTIKAGVRAKDVDAAARFVIQEAGYGEYAIHRTGHSIGVDLHEAPFLRFDEDIILQEGMLFTIEPGLYVPGVGGFRHSDTILVTIDGYEMLTELPRSIEDLTFQ